MIGEDNQPSGSTEAGERTALKLHDELSATIPAKVDAVGKRLIRLRDLFAMLDVSKPTGHRLLAAGKIGPTPIRLTSACVRFDASEIDAWLSTRRPDGSLYDAKSWPPLWDMIKRRKGI